MGQVSASSTVEIDADAGDRVGGSRRLPTVRPKILSPHYSEYRVLEGGQGAGTVASRGSCRPPSRGCVT